MAINQDIMRSCLTRGQKVALVKAKVTHSFPKQTLTEPLLSDCKALVSTIETSKSCLQGTSTPRSEEVRVKSHVQKLREGRRELE